MNDKKCDEEGKHFDILGARILHRLEDREMASMKIKDTIKQLVKLKDTVEEKWRKNGQNLTLKLEIRQYDFLPFGPFYQIGDEVMFVGFYLNSCSSIHAPMLKIKRYSGPGSKVLRSLPLRAAIRLYKRTGFSRTAYTPTLSKG